MGRKKVEERTYIYDDRNCPAGLLSIYWYWRNRIKNNPLGDEGSCVLGAGFTFKYLGNYYKMSPPTCFQGSVSWERSKEEVETLLKDAGCTELGYDWGHLD